MGMGLQTKHHCTCARVTIGLDGIRYSPPNGWSAGATSAHDFPVTSGEFLRLSEPQFPLLYKVTNNNFLSGVYRLNPCRKEMACFKLGPLNKGTFSPRWDRI